MSAVLVNDNLTKEEDQIREQKSEAMKAFEAKQNLVGFFSLLLNFE
jgi:hypothetical protein